MAEPEATPPLLFIGGRKSWEMPELTALGTLPPHAHTLPFPAGSAQAGEPAESPWVQRLGGTWEFKLLPRPEAATAAALAGDGWSPIQVPGNWTMQGFGEAHCTNLVMPVPDLLPGVPADNPTGLYRRRFQPPASWRGRQLVLHLGGCDGACYVYLNGRPVGLHKDARTPGSTT